MSLLGQWARKRLISDPTQKIPGPDYGTSKFFQLCFRLRLFPRPRSDFGAVIPHTRVKFQYEDFWLRFLKLLLKYYISFVNQHFPYSNSINIIQRVYLEIKKNQLIFSNVRICWLAMPPCAGLQQRKNGILARTLHCFYI